jgi:hypothetical protein
MSISNFDLKNYNGLEINCNNLECDSRIVRGSFVEYNTINNVSEQTFGVSPDTIAVDEVDFPIYPTEITFNHYNSSLLMKYYGMLQCEAGATGKILIDVLILNKRTNVSAKLRSSINGYVQTIYVQNQLEVVINFNQFIGLTILNLIDGDEIEVSLLVTNNTTDVITYNTLFSPMIRSLTELVGASKPFFVEDNVPNPTPIPPP